MKRSRRLQFSLRSLLLLMLVSAVAAFFWGRPKPSTISGIITVDGKPLGVATITFRSSTGTTNKVDTDPNGKYEMQLLPGTYSVGIQSNTPITKQYSSPQFSELNVSIMEGANVFDFHLHSGSR